MPLALLAKDSVQDLVGLARTPSDQEYSEPEDVSAPTNDEHQQVTQPLVPSSSSRPESPLLPTSATSDNDEGAPQTAANPQQAQEEDDGKVSHDSSYGQYSGFRSDYYQQHLGGSGRQLNTGAGAGDVGDYYYQDSYAPVVLENRQNSSLFPNLICCLFPWMKQESEQKTMNDDSSDFRPESYEQETVDHSKSKASPSPIKSGSMPPQDDENSNASDALGEKLSHKERQAVLARLGLAQPDSDTDETSQGKKGLLNGIPTYDTSPLQDSSSAMDKSPSGEDGEQTLRGILKHGSASDLVGNKQQRPGLKPEKEGSRRRSLFPSYGKSRKSLNSFNVRFAPMARVVTVKSKNEMLVEEKADIWWQKSDYEAFRKTGRIITKAMLAGGSEIWLASTSQSADSPSASTKSRTARTSFDAGDMGSHKPGDKWWHKFGHSRRGLEHVVSIEEGRERQINVRHAIHAVLEEQARQKTYKREDQDKLRIVALNHTSWARDLALASGASDADAVKSSFAESRKSREFYLLKMARTKTNRNRSLPGFMQAANRMPSRLLTNSPRRVQQQRRLDANTAAQISYRRRLSAATPPPPLSNTASKTTTGTTEISEPIRDPDPEDKTQDSLAHRAAGFLVDGEKVDMAAVLTGMGALPQKTAA